MEDALTKAVIRNDVVDFLAVAPHEIYLKPIALRKTLISMLLVS